MNTPLGTEVDLRTGHIVLDVVPAVRERGTAAPPLFAHVYCGYGRPSQLLLLLGYPVRTCFIPTNYKTYTDYRRDYLQ